jgi:enterochelin esterase-like enzyme
MHGWGRLTGLSLLHGPLHVVLVGGAVVGLLTLLLLRRDRSWWTRRVPLAVAGVVAVVALLVVVLAVLRPWPDPLPLAVLLWIGAGLLALVLLGLGWGRSGRWRRALAPAAAVLVVLGATDGIDSVFGAFPTVATALQLPPADQTSTATILRHAAEVSPPPTLGTWRPPATMPHAGAVMQVAVPATASGFAARSAWVYVPPAYLTPSHPLLPVLVLIGGQPGSPRDWLDGGQLAAQMDRWAAAHAGLAPVVVMPDALGSETANPLCMDSALGRVDTYLSSDVVSWVSSSLQVDPDHAHWAVGGFSYGGTCALQLAVAHPGLFPTFVDISGQQSPTLGGRARTVSATFGGNAQAFAAVDPLRELAAHAEPGSAGFFVVGAQDSAYRPGQQKVAAAARAAGMAVTYRELPGGHSWAVWRPALTAALPWLASRMGLPR